ncbi:DUF4012 domain-containing protein [Arthrobacter sp. FW306-05-C]|uniref:DUF4012 domain-containing protein n=1 Tax=Arthrobacter sp. FW306-05-C TaxID=2879620 RepID=UPI001F25E07E|nr:DUF4012 domain-containing protein [Arthrobacter sp. FW306-05-C]UKA65935.1 DUF4012 domain-containing protein [Arthrobacter sp. FW306-05-C]
MEAHEKRLASSAAEDRDIMPADRRRNPQAQVGGLPESTSSRARRTRGSPKGHARLFLLRIAGIFAGLLLVVAAVGGWLFYRAMDIRGELAAVNNVLPEFEKKLLAHDEAAARSALTDIQAHIQRARSSATDPVWKAAGSVPGVGKNFSTVSELVLSADDVVVGAAQPLLSVYGALDWKALKPVQGKFDLEPLRASSPSIVSAANTVDLTYQRLSSIEDGGLLPEVAQPLATAKSSLSSLRESLSVAADASALLPKMMGTEGTRHYLVLIQNNAEVRATGGLPGALAVLRIENGTMSLDAQSSGAALGKFSPAVAVDPAQTAIYSKRLGSYISDVNLTPDFPTAAKAAKAMWETRHGTQIDGVIALDPVVLSHILKASGPMAIPDLSPELGQRVPGILTEGNVVKALLSDIYSATQSNELQDAYFASVSKEVFNLLGSGKISPDQLLGALTTSVEEHRLLVWSTKEEEQDVLERTLVGGAVSGPTVGGASFGVYFNDGTGAKMDYYVRKTVRLESVCTGSDYAEYKVIVSMTNTAGEDAASALPVAVTGDGRFGTPRGTIQTNVTVYGPSLSHLDAALEDNAKVSFGSYVHYDRPVGIVTTRLEPGQTSEIEMTFVNVVQHAEPEVVVTPTLQDVKEVLLPTVRASCGD